MFQFLLVEWSGYKIKIIDENYLDLMINNEYADELLYDNNITKIEHRYSVLHEPTNYFNMCLLGNLPYAIFPHIFTLNSTYSLEKSNISYFHRNPNFSLFGQGVLIGFVDTGIDYMHPAFLNEDGTTRIFSIWDQTREEGTPPETFSFGSEYSKEAINQALRSRNPYSLVPSRDENGHGTMLAGIAAGSPDPPEEFTGIATESELVIVKLKQAKEYNRKIFSVRNDIDCYGETDLMLGIEYIRSVASQLRRPLILCIGVGTSQGDHNGVGAFSDYINELSAYHGVSVCVSAGNEGNHQRHFRGVLTPQLHAKEFELRVGKDDKEFFFELWNHSPFRLSVTIKSPTGETTQAVYPRLDICREFNFVLSPCTLYINNIVLEEESGNQLILVRFRSAISGIWKISVSNIDSPQLSVFDAWLPSGPIITTETYFLESSPDITVTNPGNARNPLTVTAYNQYNDSMLIQSGRGYSVSGELVPDLAAPGYQLTCPLPGNKYGSATGTGAAAAHAAGLQAMVMEWAILRGHYTTITGRDISRLLVRGASRNNAVTYPNPIWGYGKIDIMGLFNHLRL